MGQQDVWDSFYRSNGRAWRGNCRMPDPLGGGGDALDLGCGSGKSVSTLIDMGYRAVGLDFSDEAVSMCRERFGGAAEFVSGDVLALPFDDGSFDYVTAVHVLEHLTDEALRTAAGEIARVLRPGGYAFVRDFAPGDLRSESREGSDIRYIHRTPEELVSAFGDVEVVSAGVVEEKTRFGAVRRRSEVLLRRRRCFPGHRSLYVVGPNRPFMKCPRCGHENPDEVLFCEECDWRVDVPYIPEKKRNPVHFAGATIVLGLIAAVCAFMSGTELVALAVGAIALILGGYSMGVARLVETDKTQLCLAISGVGMILGVLGFLIGFASFVGAM